VPPTAVINDGYNRYKLWILRKSYLWFYLRIYLAATVHEKAVSE